MGEHPHLNPVHPPDIEPWVEGQPPTQGPEPTTPSSKAKITRTTLYLLPALYAKESIFFSFVSKFLYSLIFYITHIFYTLAKNFHLLMLSTNFNFCRLGSNSTPDLMRLSRKEWGRGQGRTERDTGTVASEGGFDRRTSLKSGVVVSGETAMAGAADGACRGGGSTADGWEKRR